MKGTLALRRTILPPIARDCTAAPITAAAYVVLSASLPFACSAIEVHNTTGQAIQLAVGGAGAEVIQYVCAPGLSDIIPLETLKKGVRVAAKALIADTSSGVFIVNMLG